MGKVAVSRVERPPAVGVGHGDRLAHLVVKVDGEFSVPDELVYIAVPADFGVRGVHILVEKRKVCVVVVGKYRVACEKEVTVADSKRFYRLSVPPGMREIHIPVKSGIVIPRGTYHKAVDGIAYNVVFVKIAFDVNGYFRSGRARRRVLRGDNLEADAVKLFQFIVALRDLGIDGAALVLGHIGELLIAVGVALGIDAEYLYRVGPTKIRVLVRILSVIRGAVAERGGLADGVVAYNVRNRGDPVPGFAAGGERREAEN